MNKSGKNSIEDIFKESLENFEAEYNPSDWVEMEAKLDNNAFSENSNNHSINKIFLITSSIVITALMMFFYISKENPAATHDDSIIIENNNNKVILMQIETHPEWYISVPRLNAKFSLR